MRAITVGSLLLWLAASCFGQDQIPLCPKHIESPGYPRIARVAHVTGKLVLSVTIDADGNVADAELTNESRLMGLLKKAALSNLRRWTFTRPPSAPYKETIVYDYEIDDALPVDDPNTYVKFDLPDRVTIATSRLSVQTSRPTNKN
jgi:TonB family protein